MALRSIGSIHATPTTKLVWIALGRISVSYTAGTPSTSRPAGDHCPSPATGGLANGVMGAGGGRWDTVAAAGAVVTVLGLWMVPGGSAPPTLG